MSEHYSYYISDAEFEFRRQEAEKERLEKAKSEWKAGPCRVCTEPVVPAERGVSSTYLGGRVHKRCEGSVINVSY